MATRAEEEREDPSPEEPKVDPQRKVLAAVAALQKGHAVGLAVLEKCGDHAKPKEIAQVAKEHGHSVDAIRKLRQFAKKYNEHDLLELCNLCHQHRRAFRLSLVYKIVSIRTKIERKAFQKNAISGHWSYRRIGRELRRRFTLGHKRGRKPHLPESIAEALLEIEEAKARFVELLKHCAEVAERGSGRGKSRLRELSAQLLQAIEPVKTVGKPASRTGRVSRRPRSSAR